MSTDAFRDVVYLDESLIASLLKSHEALEALPFLKTYAKQAETKKGCKCGAGNRRQAADFSRIKQTISEMSKDAKDKLKSILKAKTLRVAYKSSTGTATEKTF